MKDIRTYRTAGGTTVTWTFDQGATDARPGWASPALVGGWVCGGCGGRGFGEAFRAEQHAGRCREV